MIAESADEAVAYEAIDFGIALFEGGNAVAQAALMRWFGQADQCPGLCVHAATKNMHTRPGCPPQFTHHNLLATI